ncbi:MAG: hypothetical protein ABJA89_11215 [Lapillicoccus sp.]
MSDPSARPLDRAPHGTATPVRPPRRDPEWVRPTLIFLFGVLVGALVIAGSRPLPSSGPAPSSTPVGVVECDHVVTDSQHLVELANRAAAAAQRQDVTSLNALATELRSAESALDLDLPSCHR